PPALSPLPQLRRRPAEGRHPEPRCRRRVRPSRRFPGAPDGCPAPQSCVQAGRRHESTPDPAQGSNRMKALLAIASVCVCSATAAYAQTPAAAPAQAPAARAADAVVIPPDDGDYKIGPEDVLDISVWKNQELSRTVPVRPDGKVSLPRVNDIQAAGLTPSRLRQEVARRLSEYVPSPEVAVIVREVHSAKVSVVS